MSWRRSGFGDVRAGNAATASGLRPCVPHGSKGRPARRHLAYVYTLPADEPDVIRAFQLYRTADDAAAFLRTPEYLEYAAAVGDHLDGPPHVASAPAAWVKR